MSDKKYTALILGSTGLIGMELLVCLLKNKAYKTVYAITRRPLGIQHPKLKNTIAEINDVSLQIADLQVDVFFSCLGSTKAKTPDLKDYYAVDHDYPIEVARILKKNGCKAIAFVSSIGANVHAKNYYLKLKGETERDIERLGLDSTYIFRPSLLIGDRNEKRFGEKIAQVISPFLDLLCFGKFKDYRSIHAKTVASAMLNVSLKGEKGTHIYQTQQIKNLA
ncbi:NAD-dependent epimerase/dehydratase family protein [Sphingobacterium sp. Mn56C]|uniref:NAD-dependent epimerase/dehydratase family protein n=1 Tax=Sphingobacterium sp. Mn56C TaxID=3395261 RepID=UPI003BC1C9D8